MSVPRVARLFFYPIKSFRGIETSSLSLTGQGAQFDRQWMLVDEKNQFITQRQMPELAKIGMSLIDESQIELTRDGGLITDFGILERESEAMTVRIWKDDVPAFEVSRDVSKDLSSLLGKSVRLVRMADECRRPGRLSDQQPLLVLSEASVKGLEERAKVSLSVARFRPNIVISACAAHAEDEWPAFLLGKVVLKRLKPATRCRITQVHPLTGEVGEEPLKTLMTYRKLEKGIAFGQYYVKYHENEDHQQDIHVGQNLTFQ